jgi:drug/metabolite transporter (DMT)-like permease
MLSPRALALLSVAVACVLWGTSHPVGKLALRDVTPFQLSLVRGVVPGLGLLVAMAAFGRAHLIWQELRTRPWRILGMGTMCFFIFLNLTSAGLQHLPASMNSLFVNTSPLVLAAGAIVLQRRLPPGRVAAGLVLGFAGVALLTWRGAEDLGATGLLGALISTSASVVWAIYTAWGRSELRTGDPLAVIAASSLAAALPFGIVALITGDLVGFASIDPRALLPLGYTGLIGGTVAYALWTVGLRGVSSADAIVFVYFIPLTAVSVSIVMLGEPATAALFLGGGAILGGVALTQRGAA